MKKIYTIVASLIFSGSMIAQNLHIVREKVEWAPNETVRPIPTKGTLKAEVISEIFNPIEQILLTKGVSLTGGTTGPGDTQGRFLSPLFQDSTVKVSGAGYTDFCTDHMLGCILDPTSDLILGTEPLFTPNDSFVVKTVRITGSYVKVTPAIDTLYVWFVWAPSPNLNNLSTYDVFIKESNPFVPPIGPMTTPPFTPGWRTYILDPMVTGSSVSPGNLVKPVTQPNMVLVKYPLAIGDSTSSGKIKIIDIASKMPVLGSSTGIQIPKGNVVACFYTYVPAAGSYTPYSSCFYAFPTPQTAQDVNGFSAMVYQQTFPVLTTTASAKPMQVDNNNNWNMALSYQAFQRHQPANAFANEILANLTVSPLIDFSIIGISTGINELYNNFSLGQNEPNPFTNQTKVNYELKTAAKNVAFVVYNIAGEKVFEQIEKNVGAGKYSVNLNDVTFSSGSYFYSLTVDGYKATKKMVLLNN